MNFTPKSEEATKRKAYAPVTRYMTEKLVSFKPDQRMSEVIEIMLDEKISGAPVLTESGELLGLISEFDCLRVIVASAYYNEPISTGTVSQYMSKNIKTIHFEKDVVDAATEFLNSNVRRFPVVDHQGKVIGQISRRDILRAAREIEATNW